VAAVVGNEFELDIVTTVLGSDEDTVLTGLEEAIEARLLTEAAPFRFRFAHALVRSSILDGLAPDRRSRLHRRVAETIEAVHGDRLDEHLTELANHYAESTEATDVERAVGYAVRAGRAATDRLAHEEAAASFRLAVDLSDRPDRHAPDPVGRARLRVLLGEAQRRAGDPGHRSTLVEAGRLAAGTGDADLAAAAALANRRLLPGLLSPPDVERRQQLETAIDLVSGRDGPELCRLLAQLGFELKATDDRSRRDALSERAVVMARRVADPAALADVIMLRAETIARPDTLDERLRLVDDVLDLLAPRSEPLLTARALVLGIDASLEAARLDLVDDRLDQAIELAGELGDPSVGWLAGLARVKRLMLAGALDEAAEAASSAVALGEAAGQAEARLVLAVEGLALAGYGRRDDRRLPELMTAAGDLVDHPQLLVIRGWALGREGRVDEGRALLVEATGDGLGWLPDDENRLSLLALMAASAERLGAPETAELVVPELEPFTDRLVVDRTAVWGSVAHFAGVAAAALGRHDAAEERLVEAIDLQRRLGAPVFLAGSQTALASVLAGRGWPGDRPRLARLVEEAGATADELRLDGLRTELAKLALA
jgi:hypothetical protein